MHMCAQVPHEDSGLVWRWLQDGSAHHPTRGEEWLMIHKNFFNIKLFTPNSDSAFKSDLFESNSTLFVL